MAVIYVARSVRLGRWASDVGLGRNIYKVGVAEGDPKPLIEAGWAGETDWRLVGKQPIEDVSEAEALARLQRREKMIDPALYPKLKGAVGVFRLAADRVMNQIVVRRALAGDSDRIEIKLKPTDFAAYLMASATS